MLYNIRSMLDIKTATYGKRLFFFVTLKIFFSIAFKLKHQTKLPSHNIFMQISLFFFIADLLRIIIRMGVLSIQINLCIVYASF